DVTRLLGANMTALVASALLTVTSVTSGVAAGPVVQKTSPALMRTPPLAVAGTRAIVRIWLRGLSAIGQMLACGLSGPSDLMPGNTAVVCQRCLDADNPLPAGVEVNVGIPIVLLLAMPLLLVAVLAVSGYRYWRKHRGERTKLEHVLR